MKVVVRNKDNRIYVVDYPGFFLWWRELQCVDYHRGLTLNLDTRKVIQLTEEENSATGVMVVIKRYCKNNLKRI